MTPLFMLVVIFPIQGIIGDIYDNGHQPIVMPQLPKTSEICNYDAFMASTPFNGKVFLFPWEPSDQGGSWLRNRGICAANCAEMVTIHSKEEMDFFIDFMRQSFLFRPTVNWTNFWLGAQVHNRTFAGWTNGEPFDYDNRYIETEYNEDGLTCVHTAYKSTGHAYWYNHYCDHDDGINYFVACQRRSSWIPKKQNCQTAVTEAEPCYKTNDLVILLDASSSIGGRNYITAKSFVNKLAIAYAAQRSSRVAVYTFSNKAVKIVGLDNKLNVTEMSLVISGASYLNSSTVTELAIDAAIKEFNSHKRTVPLNLVVITDGQSRMHAKCVEAAKKAINMGIKTFAVGVGGKINKKELLAIANQKRDHVFNAKNYDELVNLLNPVSKVICSTFN